MFFSDFENDAVTTRTLSIFDFPKNINILNLILIDILKSIKRI